MGEVVADVCDGPRAVEGILQGVTLDGVVGDLGIQEVSIAVVRLVDKHYIRFAEINQETDLVYISGKECLIVVIV